MDANQQTYGPTSPPPPPPGPPPVPPPRDTGERLVTGLRSLRRSRDDRVVAGVCGGVARQLDVDPLLLRVVVAVLAVFGGGGFVLYAAGWLLLPEDDGGPSVGERAIGRGQARTSSRTILLAIALVVVSVIGIGAVFNRWDGPFLLALAVVGLVAWLVLRDSGAAPSGASGAGYPAQPPTTPLPVRPPPAPAQRRPRSHLFAITMSCVLVGIGLLTLVDVSGADVPAGGYPALALTLIGLGLLVGAWLGRSRGLILVGLVAALMTLGASASEHWQGSGEGRVDVQARPTSLEAVPTSQRYGAGRVEYDLSALDLAGTARELQLSMGAGEIVVVVPPDVDVTAHVSAGVGGVDLFGARSGGLGTDQRVTDLGGDGAGGGSLELTLQTGVGHLEVRRG